MVKDDLFNDLVMLMISNGLDAGKIRENIYLTIDKYEIGEKTTEIAVISENRNDFLIRKFLIGKTVKGLTERTMKLYTVEIPKMIEKIGKTIDDIEADDIRMYIAKRKAIDKVSKTTQANELRYLRSFFSYLHNEELIQRNPMNKVDGIKPDHKKKEAFTELEIEKMRNELETSKDKCVFELLLSTGCRVSELVNIKKSEIEQDRILVHGKGEKDRYVYINAKAHYALKKYLSDREDDNPYLFPRMIPITEMKKETPKKQLKNWYMYKENIVPNMHTDKGTIEASIRKLGRSVDVHAHPHKFRRTAATMALRRGMPIEQVSKMLGHESIETTQIYLDLSEEDLQIAHKKFVI